MKKIIMLILLSALAITSLIFLKKLFFPENQELLYGGRLRNIDDYKVEKEEEVLTRLEGSEMIKNAEFRIQGKIINLTLTVSEEGTLDGVKTKANQSITLFKEETLSFYDIQIFINKAVETEEFPAIGYKNKKTENIVWIN